MVVPPARRIAGLSLALALALAAGACAAHPAARDDDRRQAAAVVRQDRIESGQAAAAAPAGAAAKPGPAAAAPGPAAAAAPAGASAGKPVAAAASAAKPVGSGQAAAAGGLVCRARAFPLSLPVPEASGAALFPPAGGKGARILIVADSDNDGAMIEVDPASGKVLASERLPLDRGASDDLEGLSIRGDRLYVLASSGWMRSFRRGAHGGWTRVDAAYPIAKRGSGLLCRSSHESNCNKNYEGLCLRPHAAVPTRRGLCAGFAASKGDGTLYCVVFDRRGRLHIDPSRRIRVARPHLLSGCAFSPEGTSLWAGTNVFGLGSVYRIRGWRHPAQARPQRVGWLGIGNPEAIALGPGGALYRFSDTNSAPSLSRAYVCRRKGGAPAW